MLDHCGGFALSLTKWEHEKVGKLAAWVEANGWQRKVSAQIILGLSETYSMKWMIKELARNGIRQVTLLGYKSFGRGVNVKPRTINITEIIECARENYVTLGLDTMAVQNYSDVLDEVGINPLLRTEHEGRFSCYVDAVERTIARDSYTEECHEFHTDWRKRDGKTAGDVLDSVFPFN